MASRPVGSSDLNILDVIAGRAPLRRSLPFRVGPDSAPPSSTRAFQFASIFAFAALVFTFWACRRRRERAGGDAALPVSSPRASELRRGSSGRACCAHATFFCARRSVPHDVGADDVAGPPMTLVMVINARSGGGAGTAVARIVGGLRVSAAGDAAALARLPEVFILSEEGLRDALRRCADVAAAGRSVRLICAGGDGTVSAIARLLCTRKMESLVPLIVLPLGTGNDVARSMGMGATEPFFDAAGAARWFAAVRRARTRPADVWSVAFAVDAARGGSARVLRSGVETVLPESQVRGTAVLYVSVGDDASLVWLVEARRTGSRLANRALYAAFGAQLVVGRFFRALHTAACCCRRAATSPPLLPLNARIESIALADDAAGGTLVRGSALPTCSSLICVSSSSYAGGTNLWPAAWPWRSAALQARAPLCKPHMDDGMIELLTAFSLTSLGGVIATTTGVLGGLTRIAQSRSVDVTFAQSVATRKSLPHASAAPLPPPPRLTRPPSGSQLAIPREPNFARVRRRLPRPYRIGLRSLLFRGLRRRLLGEGTSTARLVWAPAESRDDDDDADARTDGNVRGYATLHRGDVCNSSDDADAGYPAVGLSGAAVAATPARTRAPLSVIVQGTPDGAPPPHFFSPSNHVALARTGSRNRSARVQSPSDNESDASEESEADDDAPRAGAAQPFADADADDGDAPLYLQVDGEETVLRICARNLAHLSLRPPPPTPNAPRLHTGEAYRLYRPSWLSIKHSGKINLVYFT